MKTHGITMAVLLLAAVSVTEIRAAEKPVPVTDAEVKDYRIGELVQLIEILGQGKTQAAIKQIEILLGKSFTKTEKSPFGEASRWASALKPFERGERAFETAEVVGIQSVSSRAKVITIVAVSDKGPVVFTFGMFRVGKSYRIGNLAFHSDWNRFPFIVGTIKERRTRLFKYAIESAAKEAKTATK